MIAHVCHLTGWTWDYVEENLTIPRLKALKKEWETYPPVPVLLAALAGVRKEPEGTHEELLERLGVLLKRKAESIC